MLSVKPIQDKNVQKDLCALCGIQYKEEYFCYGGYEDGVITAVCQFYLNGVCGIIDDIAYAPGKDSKEMLILIGKSALSFIDFCGVHKAIYVGKNTHFAEQLGFKKDDKQNLTIDLKMHCCSEN